jgi:hypothetical protein
MKEAVKHSLQALWDKIQAMDNERRRVNEFELFGYDFMID